MFLPLDLVFEYWIEHVTFELLDVCLDFLLWYSSGDVWDLELTTYHLYVGPLLGNRVWNDSGLEIWHIGFKYVCIYLFTYILMPHNMITPYFYLPPFHVSSCALNFVKYACVFLHRCRNHAFYTKIVVPVYFRGRHASLHFPSVDLCLQAVHGHLTRYVNLCVAHAPDMPGTWRKCRDACRDRLPAVAGKTFPVPGACATRVFTYLVRGP